MSEKRFLNLFINVQENLNNKIYPYQLYNKIKIRIQGSIQNTKF